MTGRISLFLCCQVNRRYTEVLNVYWHGNVTRSELYKTNKDHIRDFEDRIEEFFQQSFFNNT